ncbi:MAG TPA: glycosyltransferase family 2 protein [Sphingomicrobium sp.]|nr:glycosyltransferase family 2 protein [Sphingomicrobium sp.]
MLYAFTTPKPSYRMPRCRAKIVNAEIINLNSTTHSDSDVPSRGIGYLLAEIERGADAVGGVPSSDLSTRGLLPCIRATVKLPMIMAKRTFQQILGGAPFLVSGACGLFRTEVLRAVGLSDRTKVEDLDLTWTLVERGYRVRQCNFCIVYPQECHTLREEWLRWRRWIMGYSVCMRLHPRLLLTRFGLFSILPMFFVAVAGIGLSAAAWVRTLQHAGPDRRSVGRPLRWGRARRQPRPLEIGSDCLIGNLCIVRGPARPGSALARASDSPPRSRMRSSKKMWRSVRNVSSLIRRSSAGPIWARRCAPPIIGSTRRPSR